MENTEQQVAVWYKGSLAIYKISGGRNGLFNAELLKYDGPEGARPPIEFGLCKEGRHWRNEETNQDLLDELGKAIEIKTFGPDQNSNPRFYDSGRQR